MEDLLKVGVITMVYGEKLRFILQQIRSVFRSWIMFSLTQAEKKENWKLKK